MTAIVFGLLLLLLVIVFAGIYSVNLRNNYKAYNLLKIDPFETGRLHSDNQAQPKINADIWMVGDSRIARWDKSLLNTRLQIANLGMEGQTSTQIYYRLKNDLEIDTPAIIILEAGINDLKIIGLDSQLAEPVTRNLYRNFEEIRNLCIGNDILLIMVNIFPVGKIELTRIPLWNRTVNETIKSVNESLKKYCDDEGVYYFDAYELLSGNDETVKTEYREDFLHINRQGYEVLSLKVMELINKTENKIK